MFNFLRAKQKKSIEPADVEALLAAAESAARSDNLAVAISLYEQATQLRPDDGSVHFFLGNALFASSELQAALASYDRAATLAPTLVDLHCNRGVVLERLGRLDAALASYDQALALDPANALTHSNRAGVLLRLGRKQEALAGYERAVEGNPGNALAHFQRANLLKDLQRADEALASYDRAIAANPRFAEAYGYRGVLLFERKQWDEALSSYDQAVALHPGYAEAYYNRGVLLQARRQPEEAMADYARAIAIVPDYAEAHMNRGAALYAQKRFEEALADLDAAIALNPDYAEAFLNRAMLYLEIRQLDAALQDLDRVVALKPDSIEAHYKRGWALFEMKRPVESLGSFDRVLGLDPHSRSVLGMRTFVAMAMCDWRDLDSALQRLRSGVEAGVAVSAPMPMLALFDEPVLHRQAACIWAREEFTVEDPLPPISLRPPSAKIRIGYFSADFREHVVAQVTAELFAAHDRSKFEITAFAFGPRTGDALRLRLERVFDRFLDVSDKPDREVALLARSLNIDIAVDLGGYTAGSRTKIFSWRAAPIQVNYLGYPGTMGMGSLDYLIADRTVVPEAYRHYYTEKVVCLPDTFLPDGSTRALADKPVTREQFDLPAMGFVFCCFNSPYKINPVTFDGWMRILGRVPGSVLWFSQSDPIAAGNLRQAAAERGIAAERLIFAARLPALSDHLARQTLGDLFLDTLPYNAHATAMDALWAGLPVLTRIGNGFAGRVAASLLHTLDLPELVAETQEHYEDLAVELATDPQRVATIRRKLLSNRRNASIVDMRVYTRHLESAYEKMWQRYQAQLPPDHIVV